MATTESTPAAAPIPQQRYVPGAPPPTQSKKSKKKPKSGLKNLVASAHEAALTDHAPDAQDIKAGKVDPSLLANPPPPSSAGQDTGNNTEADEPKSSAEADKSLVVEAIAKRIKALGKKVQRVKEYKEKEPSSLNEDQKQTIASLPAVEAGIKELEGIRKTIESLEASSRREQARQRTEQQKLVEQRIAEATQQVEASLLPRVTSLLSFLALRNLLHHSTPTDLSISEPERHAIVSAGDNLLAYPPVSHVEEIVKGFLSGTGSWEDIEYSRILEITSQFAAPRTPTPMPEQPDSLDPTTTAHIESQPEEAVEPEPEVEVEPEPEVEVEPEPTQSVMISSDLGFVPQTTGGGFHFMQESELDTPGAMSESQEWVSVPPTGDDAAPEGGEVYVQSEDVVEEQEVVQAEFDAGTAGTEVGGAIGGADAAGGAPLDWAATGDEGDELPDLGGLQATFGGSGSATPIAQPAGGAASAAATKTVTIDDDGFTAIPSRRGHTQRGSYGGRSRGPRGSGEGFRGRGGYRGEGRGRGEFRGDGERRGGYRGEGEGRGGYRGESRGEGEGRGGYRGEGEGRGGYRGEGEGRGGYRGGGEGGDGGYRGRGRGGYFGAHGEGGEGGRGGRGGYRGGRGEGRGGFRGRSGSGPATPTPDTAA